MLFGGSYFRLFQCEHFCICACDRQSDRLRQVSLPDGERCHQFLFVDLCGNGVYLLGKDGEPRSGALCALQAEPVENHFRPFLYRHADGQVGGVLRLSSADSQFLPSRADRQFLIERGAIMYAFRRTGIEPCAVERQIAVLCFQYFVVDSQFELLTCNIRAEVNILLQRPFLRNIDGAERLLPVVHIRRLDSNLGTERPIFKLCSKEEVGGGNLKISVRDKVLFCE